MVLRSAYRSGQRSIYVEHHCWSQKPLRIYQLYDLYLVLNGTGVTGFSDRQGEAVCQSSYGPPSIPGLKFFKMRYVMKGVNEGRDLERTDAHGEVVFGPHIHTKYDNVSS